MFYWYCGNSVPLNYNALYIHITDSIYYKKKYLKKNYAMIVLSLPYYMYAYCHT